MIEGTKEFCEINVHINLGISLNFVCVLSRWMVVELLTVSVGDDIDQEIRW